MIQDDDTIIERRQYFDLHWRDKLINLATDAIDKNLREHSETTVQLRHSSFLAFMAEYFYVNAVLCDPNAGVCLVRAPYHMSKKISFPITQSTESLASQFVDEIRDNYIKLTGVENILIF